MINFDKLKLVLFDFDDTLCIHPYHHNYSKKETEEYNKALMNGEYPKSWDSAKVSGAMLKFVKYCNQAGKEIGIISAVGNFKAASTKQSWAETVYGVDFENYCVGESRKKAEQCTYIAKAKNLCYDEILIVDDWWELLADAADLGIQAATPIECTVWVEDNLQQ